MSDFSKALGVILSLSSRTRLLGGRLLRDRRYRPEAVIVPVQGKLKVSHIVSGHAEVHGAGHIRRSDSSGRGGLCVKNIEKISTNRDFSPSKRRCVSKN